MISRIRAQLGHAGFVVAIVALVAALAGGAYAASPGLTGKQKKEVEKIAKKFAGAPGAPGTAGANGKDGANGTNGKDGANGTNGAPGASGKSVVTGTEAIGTGNCGGRGGSWVEVEGSASKKFACNGLEGSPWTAGGTLPSEATETGAWLFAGDATAEQVVPISWSIPLSTTDAAAIQPVFTDTDGDTTCTGTSHNPTAPPGKICFYISESNSLSGLLLFSTDFQTPGVGTGGAFLFGENLSTDKFAEGSFAITAP
jgi:hypothetical protein